MSTDLTEVKSFEKIIPGKLYEIYDARNYNSYEFIASCESIEPGQENGDIGIIFNILYKRVLTGNVLKHPWVDIKESDDVIRKDTGLEIVYYNPSKSSLKKIYKKDLFMLTSPQIWFYNSLLGSQQYVFVSRNLEMHAPFHVAKNEDGEIIQEEIHLGGGRHQKFKRSKKSRRSKSRRSKSRRSKKSKKN